MKIVLEREDLRYAVSNLAYILTDTLSDHRTAHDLHNVADICAPGNCDRTDSLMRLAVAEAVSAMGHGAVIENAYAVFQSGAEFPERVIVETGHPALEADSSFRLKTEAEEFVTARVLAGWLHTVLPEAAGVWEERAAEWKARLSAAALSRGIFRLRVSPI